MSWYFHCRTSEGALPTIPASHVQSILNDRMTLTNGVVLELVAYRMSLSPEWNA